jgi:hypothetical protein
MSITTNNADSFQGSTTTIASSNNAFPPFLGTGGGGGNLVPPNADGDILLILAADMTNSTTTGVEVPDLSFRMTAGKLYLIEGFIWSDAPGSTIGFQFLHGTNAVLPSPPNTLVDFINGHYDSPQGLTTVLYTAPRLLNTYSAGTNNLNSPFDCPHKIITICRAATTGFGSVTDKLSFYFRSEVAGSAVVIKAGSCLRLREMS